MTTASALYARQFLASQAPCNVGGLTVQHAFGHKLVVSTHPLLRVSQHQCADREILILGDIIDPRHPRWRPRRLHRISTGIARGGELRRTASRGASGVLLARPRRLVAVHLDPLPERTPPHSQSLP